MIFKFRTIQLYFEQFSEGLFRLPKSYWLGIIIATSILTAMAAMSQSARPNLAIKSVENMDTLIPAGFVLVPIEVQNYETLDSILGKYGVVDLYSLDPQRKSPKKPLVKGIRIIRSPKNPHHFAVLAPESQAHQLVQSSLPFFVIIQNPKSNGTDFVKTIPKLHTRKILETNP